MLIGGPFRFLFISLFMKTLLLLLLLATSSLAQTKPGELKKAKSDFAKADTSLNAAYKTAIEGLGEEEKARLREDQRGWIEYRDFMAKAQPQQAGDDGEKPESSAAYWDMMAGLSDDRATWLASFTKKDLPAGLTGEWMDSRGGWLYLEERKDGLAFGIEVVRGTSSNLGGMAGLAVKTKEGALYMEKVPATEKRPPCILTFKLSGGTLELTGENTDPFHGARAYFNGKYRKVAKLKKPVNTEKSPIEERL